MECNKCKNKENVSNVCSICKDIHYCDNICQKADWKEHKKICKPFMPTQLSHDDIFLSSSLEILPSKKIPQHMFIQTLLRIEREESPSPIVLSYKYNNKMVHGCCHLIPEREFKTEDGRKIIKHDQEFLKKIPTIRKYIDDQLFLPKNKRINNVSSDWLLRFVILIIDKIYDDHIPKPLIIFCKELKIEKYEFSDYIKASIDDLHKGLAMFSSFILSPIVKNSESDKDITFFALNGYIEMMGKAISERKIFNQDLSDKYSLKYKLKYRVAL